MKEVSSGTLSEEAAGIRLGRRLWLDHLGEPVFGNGIRELLVRVESTGSLRRAASDMGMAYSKAWEIVRRAEANLGFALLCRHAGGKTGGGSTVSDDGRWLIGAFGALVDEANPLLEGLYAKHFGGWSAAGRGVSVEKTGTDSPSAAGK
jgi:molybdate transport system regulatory protein